MANAKEIQERMSSINDTLKITNAMYMISSSKLKKSKKMLQDTEPYFYELQTQMSRILRHVPDIESKYFEKSRDEKKDPKVGYIVITADKGLAGSYNHNILKIAEEEIKAHKDNKLFVLGEVGRHYFEKRGVHIDKQFHYTIQNPTLNRARNITEELLELYVNNELDEIHIIYTKMINPIKEEAEIKQLLPLYKTDFQMKIPADIPLEQVTFRPSPEEVMNKIVPAYIEGFVFGALVESYSCEQNARNMLQELSVLYNRARQAAITQEITEVIAGAKSQKNKK